MKTRTACFGWVTVAMIKLRKYPFNYSVLSRPSSHFCSPFARRLPSLLSALLCPLRKSLCSALSVRNQPKEQRNHNQPIPMRNQPKVHIEKSLPKTQTTIQNYRNQIAQTHGQTHGQTTINTQKDRKKEEEEEEEKEDEEGERRN